MQHDNTSVAQPSATSNTGPVLDQLAKWVAVQYSRSIEPWLVCADLLLEARGIAGHGEWLPFLAQAGIPARTAQDMLSVARAGIKSATVAHLGVAGTLRALRHTSDDLIAFVKEHGGSADDAALYTHEMLYAQECCRTMAEDLPKTERGAILASMPDGPLSLKAWLDFLEAMAAAADDEDRRAVWGIRPWAPATAA